MIELQSRSVSLTHLSIAYILSLDHKSLRALTTRRGTCRCKQRFSPAQKSLQYTKTKSLSTKLGRILLDAWLCTRWRVPYSASRTTRRISPTSAQGCPTLSTHSGETSKTVSSLDKLAIFNVDRWEVASIPSYPSWLVRNEFRPCFQSLFLMALCKMAKRSGHSSWLILSSDTTAQNTRIIYLPNLSTASLFHGTYDSVKWWGTHKPVCDQAKLFVLEVRMAIRHDTLSNTKTGRLIDDHALCIPCHAIQKCNYLAVVGMVVA